MTENEKITKLKLLASDSNLSDEALALYLSMAEDKILSRVYPFKDTTLLKADGTKRYPMPTRYDNLQVELASRYIFRRGFEGQISSTESGIVREFHTANDEDLLKEVVQIVGVV